MAECTELLDQALELGRRELVWLRKNDVEKAAACSEERGLLITQAWSAYGHCPDMAYTEKLEELSRIQDLLVAEARSRREEMRAGLCRSRCESRRLAGYQMAVQQARIQ